MFSRVLAENEYGIGAPASTKDPVMVSEVPGTPGFLKCVGITKSTVTLEWSKPEYDGGSEILEYIVEQQLRGKSKTYSARYFTLVILLLT